MHRRRFMVRAEAVLGVRALGAVTLPLVSAKTSAAQPSPSLF
jgi:hypothetical protein